MKIKNTRYAAEHEKGTNLEDQLMRKNDENNDLKRKILNLESAFKVAENDLRDERNELENLRADNSKLKLKVLESGQNIRKEFDGKDHESRKAILKLNEEISDLNLQLNEEKSRNLRLNSETTRYKTEKLRLEEFCD